MSRIVFRGGRVFDGTGSPPSTADVAVDGRRIVEVGPGLDGDEAIDLAGRTVLPGFFDCHVHVVMSHLDTLQQLQTPFSYRFFEAVGNLERTLAVGITSVRDAGGADLGVKRAVDDGLIRGPRLQVSLGMISQTGGHGDSWFPAGVDVPLFPTHPGLPSTLVDGPDEMRRTVRTLIRMGADVIKVATSGGVLSPRDDPRHAHLRPAELEVLVEEATAAGRFVMAHAQAADGIKNAIRAGIRSIEHGIYLDDEAIDLMLEHGTYLVATLVAPQGVLDAAASGVQFPAAVIEKADLVIETHRAAFRRAVEAGVRIAMGTDSGVTPHGRNLRELELMVAGGMTPTAALVATTKTAAELLGVSHDRGTIEPGRRADLVVLEGDPLDVADLGDRVRAVYQDGILVSGAV
jgi:imidazolonepropionase-like amidohydrolase